MMTKTQPLETLIGPLVTTIWQLEPETIQHADQLNNERRTNQELRNQWFITGDFSAYRCEEIYGKQEPILYLARAKNNLIFQHPDKAIPQLLNGDHNYRPSKESIDVIVKDPTTLKIQLSKLNLKGDGKEWKYIEIDTTNYTTLNDEEQKLAERTYGSMQKKSDEEKSDFEKNMAMLKENKIATTRIYVLTPDYVKEKAKTKPIARAGGLYGFGFVVGFDAVDWGVDDFLGALRGVRRQ